MSTSWRGWVRGSGARRAGAWWIAALVVVGCGGRRGDPDANHAPGAHDDLTHEEPARGNRVELSSEAVRNARILVGRAGPASLALTVEAPGEVHLNAEQVLEVRPRYAGVIREIRKRIGDRVTEGEVLAVIHSSESLTDYEIASSMAGTVISRPVVTGQAVDRESILLTVADLSTVWVEFAVYPQHVGRIRTGMPVAIAAQNRPELSASGRVNYVGPLLEQDTRVSSARVVLPNPAGDWQPGLFVVARVTLERLRVPVAVPEEAVVRTSEGAAVFRAQGARFELQPVAVGRSDGRSVEILAGLAPGDSVVVANAFVLKSELGKGGAEHEH